MLVVKNVLLTMQDVVIHLVIDHHKVMVIDVVAVLYNKINASQFDSLVNDQF